MWLATWSGISTLSTHTTRRTPAGAYAALRSRRSSTFAQRTSSRAPHAHHGGWEWAKVLVRLGVDGESACRRGSVHRALSGCRMGGHPSVRPTWGHRPGQPSHDLALLRVGFAEPPGHPGRWCALTAPFHPCLIRACARPSAVCSLWHFPAGRPDWPLASTLPCGAPTFLDRVMPGRDHPADSPSATDFTASGDLVVGDAREPRELGALQRPRRALDRVRPGQLAVAHVEVGQPAGRHQDTRLE